MQIENPIDGLGQPIDMFGKPALELGSDAATARLAALRDQSVGKAAAAQGAEVARLNAEHEAARANLEKAHGDQLAKLRAEQAEALRAAEAERAKVLTETKSARAAEIASLEAQLIFERDALVRRLADARAKGEAEVAALERDYKAKLDELTTGNEPAVVAASAERERLLAAESEKTSAALAEVRRANEAELEKLQAEHAVKRGEVLTRQLQEMAELETRLATERRSLEQQLENAQEIISLRTQLIESLKAGKTLDDQVLHAFEAERKMRMAIVKGLSADWVGTAICTEKGKPQSELRTAVKYCAESTQSNGLQGYIHLSGAGGSQCGGSDPRISAANLVFLGDPLQFPVKIRLAISKRLNWVGEGMDGELDSAGRIFARANVQMNVENTMKDFQCEYHLSQS